jgi:hypothetical protein
VCNSVTNSPFRVYSFLFSKYYPPHLFPNTLKFSRKRLPGNPGVNKRFILNFILRDTGRSDCIEQDKRMVQQKAFVNMEMNINTINFYVP